MKKYTVKLIVGIFLLCGCVTNNDIKQTNGEIVVSTPSKNSEYYLPFKNDIKKFHNDLLNSKDDSVSILDHNNTNYDDIWIRDIAPVITNKMTKFVYEPEYLDKVDSNYLDKNFNKWLNKQDYNITYSSLILDGGNVVWNKKDTIIVTNRILSDNNHLNKNAIIETLKKDLGIEKVIIVPAEKGDVLAHADGMVKFIDDNKLFISDFLGDRNFKNKIEKIILKELPNVEFITLKSAYTSEGQYDKNIASARGLYINMLETDNTIYIPQFNLKEDKEMFDFITKHVKQETVAINVGKLSTMGGALNCLTWYIPSKVLNK